MKLTRMIREYKNYLREKKAKARLAEGNEEYLLNLFGDYSLLEECIKKVGEMGVRCTLITLDGTRLVIEMPTEKKRSISWERD